MPKKVLHNTSARTHIKVTKVNPDNLDPDPGFVVKGKLKAKKGKKLHKKDPMIASLTKEYAEHARHTRRGRYGMGKLVLSSKSPKKSEKVDVGGVNDDPAYESAMKSLADYYDIKNISKNPELKKARASFNSKKRTARVTVTKAGRGRTKKALKEIKKSLYKSKK